MTRLAASLALLLLSAPAPALAQGGNPFGPLSPQTPPPQPQPAPPQQPAQSDDDRFLGTTEALGFAAIALVLIGGVFVAIVRDGGRGNRGVRRRKRRETDPRAPATEPSKRGAAAFRSSAPAKAHTKAKAPPPPPRKRRAKAKRK